MVKASAARVVMMATACAAASLLTAGRPALAAEPVSEDPVVDQTEYSSAQVENSIVENSTNAIQFTREQATAGRLVDLESVNTSELPDLTLVWEDGTEVGDVMIESAVDPANPEDIATAVGFETFDDVDASPVVDEATGTGLQASSFSGSTYNSGQCYTATIDRGKMTYCGIKYRVNESNPTYNFYWYDRWVTATGTVVDNGLDNKPVKIDIRTRPASSGSNIQAMLDYGPRGPVTSCNDVITLSGGVASWGATIPISECSEVTPYPDGKEMRVVYDQGAVFSGRVHAVEMGVVYRTAAGVTAYTGHYNYTKFCRNTYATCDSVSATVGDW